MPASPLKPPKYAPPPHAKHAQAMAHALGLRPVQAFGATGTGAGRLPAAAGAGAEAVGGGSGAAKASAAPDSGRPDRPATTGSSAGVQLPPASAASASARSQLSASMRSPSAPRLASTARNSNDLTSSVVLHPYEYYGLHALANKSAAQESEAQRKHERREQSKARYAHWGNTLEALREKKKRDRQSRLAQQELEQQKLDEAEARVQADARAAAIDRAGRMLYQENDRVKEFHSALLLSSVLKERQHQIDLSRVKKQHNARVDAMHFEAIKATVARLKASEDAEVAERREKAQAFAKVQEQQLAATLQRRRAEAMEEIRQGDVNRKLAIEAVAEQRASEEQKKRDQRAFNVEYLRMNEEQKKLKAENAKLEALEDAKIKEFAAEKERTLQLRKEVEAARFKAKHDNYQKMLKEQYHRLEKLKNEEQTRIDRHADELMRKTDERVAAETKKSADNLDELKRTRARQRERALAERRERLREENEMIAQWKLRADQMAEAERARAAATRASAQQTQHFLMQQMNDAKTRAQAQRIDDLEFVRQRELQNAREEAELQRYAEGAIADFQAMDKATIPLKIALAGVKRNRDLRPTVSS